MTTIASITISMVLYTSTLLVSSSNTWQTAWACLELNAFSILPQISKTKHPRAIEAATKYFLTQATASCMLLFSATANAWQTGSWDITQMHNNWASTMMLIAIAMKVGAAPTHFWLPEVMQGSTLTTALIISTWQKIAPVALMYSTFNHIPPNLAIIIGLLSMVTGGWGGMNQTQLRKMMAYSSITNMGWTVMILPIEPKMSIMNILIYIIMTIPTFMLMKLMLTKTLKDTATSWTTSATGATALMFLLLSTAGLPPLTGLAPKIMILMELINQGLTPAAVLATTASLLNLVFYLRTAYLTTILNPPGSATLTAKWRQKIHSNAVVCTPTATTSIMTTPALVH
uniref:NADH-ubiquinone oxidoreductase chain 2 n=1 Tax=Otocryptis wiegmanni TaxID=118220 RepID=Q9G650_9SAUR|nr:NADH dehydrogenase subunit 2 [Otocryptis wiegmanni]